LGVRSTPKIFTLVSAFGVASCGTGVATGVGVGGVSGTFLSSCWPTVVSTFFQAVLASSATFLVLTLVSTRRLPSADLVTPTWYQPQYQPATAKPITSAPISARMFRMGAPSSMRRKFRRAIYPSVRLASSAFFERQQSRNHRKDTKFHGGPQRIYFEPDRSLSHSSWHSVEPCAFVVSIHQLRSTVECAAIPAVRERSAS